jgi:hypothetical protein
VNLSHAVRVLSFSHKLLLSTSLGGHTMVDQNRFESGRSEPLRKPDEEFLVYSMAQHLFCLISSCYISLSWNWDTSCQKMKDIFGYSRDVLVHRFLR